MRNCCMSQPWIDHHLLLKIQPFSEVPKRHWSFLRIE
jgi:hypothetical protein